jgi:hypothetical protein
VIAGALGLILAVFVGRVLLADDPFGGEPMVVVRTDLGDAGGKKDEVEARPAVQNTVPGGAPADAAPQTVPATTPPPPTVTIIDGKTGQRQEVPIGGTSPAKHPEEQSLTEPSRHGPLPRIAQDGTRPADAYARAAKTTPGMPNAPRVAIVVAGLGIGANGTNDALTKLPGPVTFAFAPYASDLERLAARARDGKHEMLLQVPMEPFDYPDNDPGPQTLLTSLDGPQNVDRLQWLMSRFQGYVGLASYMGARSTASEQALAPVLRETAKRGLIYLDDGSSSRSLAGQIAGANNLAFAKADLTIDSVPTAAEVDRALARLEAIARDRGVAIGVASALPISIDRIARWAKTAESRGVLLVPISNAANKAKSS